MSKPICTFTNLFLLPPYAHRSEYHQLLIAYSYCLAQSQMSGHLTYTSPARPLNGIALAACQTYWQNQVLTHLFKTTEEPIQSIALDTLARQTCLHPRDILFCLYFNRFIRSHPNDASTVYVLNAAQEFRSAKNVPIKTNFLLQQINLTEKNVADDPNK